MRSNTAFDIPYIGGYSCDGKNIYVDRHLPDSFISSVGLYSNVHDYLFLHEVTEITMQIRLNMTFNDSHRIAVGAEQVKLMRDGVPIDEYYHFIYSKVKERLEKPFEFIPSDLCLRPYLEDRMHTVIDKMRLCTDLTCKCIVK